MNWESTVPYNSGALFPIDLEARMSFIELRGNLEIRHDWPGGGAFTYRGSRSCSPE